MEVVDAEAIVKALDGPFAVIDFTPDGTVLFANTNFLSALGYSDLAEIKGKHHRQFLFEEEISSEEYADFWIKLQSGQFFSDEFRRKCKDGSEIWIAANYVPILDAEGRVQMVRKYASDVTDRRDAMSAILDALDELGKGRMSVRLDDQVRGEFKHIRDEFNTTMSALDERISTISGVMQRSNDTVSSVAESAHGLSKRSEQQAASLEETSASVNTISGRIKENSEAAEQAETLSQDTAKKASKGESVVKESIDAMERIEKITAEVTKITKVIESFAFQTNLLSINAAVEAARAGDAGRGFSVVASEVRSLAQRSSEASKDIARLTQESEEEVAKGSRLVRSAGEELQEIGSAAVAVEEAVRQITGSSKEQALAVSEIEVAMRELDTGVNEVAESARQSVHFADKLNDEMDQLENVIKNFETTSSDTSGLARAG